MRGLAWLIEVRGLANKSEGPRQLIEVRDCLLCVAFLFCIQMVDLWLKLPANRSEGLGAGLAQALLIKVRGWRGWAVPGPCQ